MLQKKQEAKGKASYSPSNSFDSGSTFNKIQHEIEIKWYFFFMFSQYKPM